MPRNVRNCWIDANISGRKNTLSGGPKSANGGIYAVICVRENGAISDKKLVISIFPENDKGLSVKAYWNDTPVVNETLER